MANSAEVRGNLAVARKLLIAATAFVLILSPKVVAFDPTVGDYHKASPSDIRLVTYNTLGNFISTPSKDAAFNRILTALAPDVLVLEEMHTTVTLNQIATRLNTIMPITPNSWQTHDGLSDGTMRVVIASRYPLTMGRTDTIPASSTRGVNIVLVDLPNAQYNRDLYLLGVHLKASSGSSNDAKRQRSADAIASWLGDARQAGGNVTLPANTPMIVLGDFNLVGPSPQPEITLLTGDIVDNTTFGQDVKGDWDVSNITDLTPADPFTGDTFTWQGNATYPPSRLDRFMYTDSVTTVAHTFILNTLTMTAAACTAAGLQANDTATTSTSDHLPITMDVHFLAPQTCSNPFADADGDGDVDQEDFGAWQVCASGSGLPASDACYCFDRDKDADVDAADLAAFLNCDSGPNTPANPACASP